MKKRTIVIVAVTLILALLVVAIIATFPTYLFEDLAAPDDSSVIQSGNIIESDGESTEGDDVGVLGGEDDIGSTEAVLPTAKDEELGYTEVPEAALNTIAEAKGVKVLAENGAFPDGTKVKIRKLGIFDRAYYRSRHYLKGIATEFTAYNLTAKKGGEAQLPNGLVKLSFTIPEDYNSANVAVYYLLSSRGVQEIECEVSEDGKIATVKVSQTGVYILVEKDTESNSQENNSSNNTSTESEQTDSNVSSNISSSTSSGELPTDSSSEVSSDNSDVSSDPSSSDAPTDSSSDSSTDTSSDSSGNSSDNSSGDAPSEPEGDTSSDSDSSSDNTSSEDPNKETMDGWTPWY